MQNLESIAISITKSQKYCNTYYKISKYCNKYCKILKYCNILQYHWNHTCLWQVLRFALFSIFLNFEWSSLSYMPTLLSSLLFFTVVQDLNVDIGLLERIDDDNNASTLSPFLSLLILVLFSFLISLLPETTIIIPSSFSFTITFPCIRNIARDCAYQGYAPWEKENTLSKIDKKIIFVQHDLF